MKGDFERGNTVRGGVPDLYTWTPEVRSSWKKRDPPSLPVHTQVDPKRRARKVVLFQYRISSDKETGLCDLLFYTYHRLRLDTRLRLGTVGWALMFVCLTLYLVQLHLVTLKLHQMTMRHIGSFVMD